MRRIYFLFGGACLLLVQFFHQGFGHNQSSRLLTVYALVENHTLQADQWRGDTGDYALVNGHVYSDKAPLSSFLVVPYYWAWRAMEGGTQSTADKSLALHLGNLVAAGLPFAIFAVLLLAQGLRQGATPLLAVSLALSGAFGTCLATYGGIYMGHMLAATLVLGAYILACEQERHFAVAGALAGCAVLAEYPTAVLAILILGYFLDSPQRWRQMTLYILGAMPPLLLMLGYHKAITGSGLDLPYHYVGNFEYMQHGYGFRGPDGMVIWELMFGQYRGAMFYAPLLLLLLPAVMARFPGPQRRQVLLFCMMGCYLILISGYSGWHGDWCSGPRYLIPIIVLAIYEGTAAMAGWQGWLPAYFCLATAGALLTLSASATDCAADPGVLHPAFDLFLPNLARGQLNPHNLAAELGFPNGVYLLVVWCGMLLACGRLFAKLLVLEQHHDLHATDQVLDVVPGADRGEAAPDVTGP